MWEATQEIQPHLKYILYRDIDIVVTHVKELTVWYNIFLSNTCRMIPN
jgi:hypothetical protein